MTKTLFRTIFCVLLCVCVQHPAFAQTNLKLKGKILKASADTILLSFSENKIAYYPIESKAKLDKEGNFSLTATLPAGYTQVQLHYANKIADLLLQPGDDLILTANITHFDSTVHYTGKGSEVQNFIAKHVIERQAFNQYADKVRPFVPQEPAAFEKGLEDEKAKEMAFLQKNSKGLPASFIKYWTDFYKYYNYYYTLQYPQVHEMVKLKRYTDTIPDEDYALLEKVPYAFNDSLLDVSPYLLYVTSAVQEKLKAKGYSWHGSDTVAKRRVEDSVRTLATAMLPDKTAAYFFAQDLYGRAKLQDMAKTKAQLAWFKKHWPQSEYLPTLEKQVGIAERISPGMPAPDMTIYDSTGKQMHLSDLKGKVVYLGFWAQWCRQCVGEMISEKKVRELIHDKPLAFVYVAMSTEADTAKENALIKRYKFNGYYAHATESWYSKAIVDYGVQSLPAYYLIDEDGKFAIQLPPTPMQYTELILAIEKLFK